MTSGTLGEAPNACGVELFRSLRRSSPARRPNRLELLQQEAAVVGKIDAPCDETGSPA
jgi:hypothetical protein